MTSRHRDTIGSDIDNFKKIIRLSNELIKKIGTEEFLSPYSIIPIISQVINLESPMMGSGSSPYSVITHIFRLQDKKINTEIDKLTLAEKRQIIDELYDMIAPFLLGEEDAYIELLVRTKYRTFLSSSTSKEKKLKREMKEKFLIAASLFSLLSKKRNGNFAHLSHYGFIEDLYREQNFLHSFPSDVANEWYKGSYPIVTEIAIKGFNNKEIKGWIIFVPNSTEQLIRDQKLRESKILKAALLAEKLGSPIVGMAGLIASFGKGGFYLTDHIKTIGFTTGHAFTVGAIIQIAKKAAEVTRLNLENATVAIIGAGGSIGSGCSKMLAEERIKSMVLVELAALVAKGRLEGLRESIKKINPSVSVMLSTDVTAIKSADLVVVATNSLESIVKAEYLKPGAIVIDDSFPKNVSKRILQQRDDIILLEVVIRLPLSLDINATRNMPDLMDVSLVRLLTCKEIYACFAETLTLALLGHKGSYGLGQSDPTLAKEILQKSAGFGFLMAPLQSFGQAVSKERFEKAIEFRNSTSKDL